MVWTCVKSKTCPAGYRREAEETREGAGGDWRLSCCDADDEEREVVMMVDGLSLLYTSRVRPGTSDHSAFGGDVARSSTKKHSSSEVEVSFTSPRRPSQTWLPSRHGEGPQYSGGQSRRVDRQGKKIRIPHTGLRGVGRRPRARRVEETRDTTFWIPRAPPPASSSLSHRAEAAHRVACFSPQPVSPGSQAASPPKGFEDHGDPFGPPEPPRGSRAPPRSPAGVVSRPLIIDLELCACEGLKGGSLGGRGTDTYMRQDMRIPGFPVCIAVAVLHGEALGGLEVGRGAAVRVRLRLSSVERPDAVKCRRGERTPEEQFHPCPVSQQLARTFPDDFVRHPAPKTGGIWLIDPPKLRRVVLLDVAALKLSRVREPEAGAVHLSRPTAQRTARGSQL